MSSATIESIPNGMNGIPNDEVKKLTLTSQAEDNHRIVETSLSDESESECEFEFVYLPTE